MTAAPLSYAEPGGTGGAATNRPMSKIQHRTQLHVRPMGNYTARELIGKRVEGYTGDRLAVVNDVVINPRTGRIVYVVLSSGGFIGVGAQLRPVPPSAITMGWAKNGILALNVIPKRWKTAPRMNKERLADLENAEAAKKIYSFYNQPWPTNQTTGSATASTELADSPIGHLKLASELIGESVLNQKHAEVGRVLDLAVDLKNPGMTRAIVAPTDSKRSRFAVPLNVFSADKAGNALFLNTDLRSFQTFQKAESPTTDPDNSGA